MLVILFMSGLPVTMLLVPVYQMFVRLSWINSMFWTSMFIAASTLPFTIWLLKNFIDQVPRELEEAAAIEGTSNVQIVLRVVIPLATPGILVTSLVAFINAWGAFVIPLVLDSNPNDTPGSIAIYQFLTRERTDPLRRSRRVLDPVRGARRRPVPVRVPPHLRRVHLRRGYQGCEAGL